MKVLLQTNVSRLGQIGDIVDVKPGYARNYLLPQGLGVHPTQANLKAIEAAKQRHLEELARQREQIEAQAALIKGKEITMFARANEEGLLYGSIGPAQIAAALAAEGIFVDVKYIDLDEPIRQLDKYDIQVKFAPEVTAMIHVWVVPAHDSERPEEGGDDEAPAPETGKEGDVDEQTPEDGN